MNFDSYYVASGHEGSSVIHLEHRRADLPQNERLLAAYREMTGDVGSGIGNCGSIFGLSSVDLTFTGWVHDWSDFHLTLKALEFERYPTAKTCEEMARGLVYMVRSIIH